MIKYLSTSNGTFFNDYNLLGRDGIYLSRRGKGFCGSSLANLVWQALNRRTSGRGGGKGEDSPKSWFSSLWIHLGNKPGQPQR